MACCQESSHKTIYPRPGFENIGGRAGRMICGELSKAGHEVVGIDVSQLPVST